MERSLGIETTTKNPMIAVAADDSGANVWAKSPAPAGNATGKETAREYDSAGRLSKETVLNTGAYTRYEYPANNIRSKVFATLVDTDNDGADADDEVMSEAWTDGAGRVRRSRTEHPGSTGGWAATLAEYDILGQVRRSTVPTEVSVGDPNDPATWTPAGDDERGTDPNGRPVWLWNSTEYDWKGRVTRTVPTDSNGSDGKDQLIGYEGCGCAGGQITTVRGPVVPRDDDPNQTARRTEKVYEDILGRTYKTEVLNWTGGVYTTTVQTFNARDQVTRTRQHAGNETGPQYRDSTATYDGFGRLASSHSPTQDSNVHNEFTYFPDGSVSTVSDGRDATKHFIYGVLGRISQIGWTAPSNSGIEVAGPVTFSYDPLGNRTSMADGLGTVAYEYDSLSRLTAETRQFTDTVPGAPISNNSFRFEYGYSLSGALASYREPYGEFVTYGFDKAGRTVSVTGYRPAENVQLQYIWEASYRAWGASRQIGYGNMTNATFQFDNGLRPVQYDGGGFRMQYGYYNDGRLRTSDKDYPGSNSLPNFDRLYQYDHVGRMTKAKTGAEARGQTEPNANNRPYRVSVDYNPFGDVTGQERLHWTSSFTTNYAISENGRTTSQVNVNQIPNWVNSNPTYPWVFDADGRQTGTVGQTTNRFDAAGRLIWRDPYPVDGNIEEYEYDGNGQIAKSVEIVTAEFQVSKYHVNSSVLGPQIVRVWSNGGDGGLQRRVKVVAAGNVIAERRGMFLDQSFATDATFLKFEDSNGTEQAEQILQYSGVFGNAVRFLLGGGTLDPFGAAVGEYNPYPTGAPPDYPDCDIGYDGEPTDPCDMEGYDDPDNANSETGSVPKNTYYVNGFEMQLGSFNPEFMEIDNGPVKVHMRPDGSRYITPNRDNSPNAFTNNGRWIKTRTDSEIDGVTDYGPEEWAFVPDDDKQFNGVNDWQSPFHFFSTDERLSDEDCDAKLSRIFGGVAKAMEKGRDLNGLDRSTTLASGTSHSATPGTTPMIYDPAKKKLVRNPDNGGILHIYTDSTASPRKDIPLTVPGGWIAAASYFTGGNPGLVFYYANGIAIEFVHVGTTNKNGIPSMPKNPGAGNLVTIGFVGGLGSTQPGATQPVWGETEKGFSPLEGQKINYNHTHIVFFSDKVRNTRVDPRVVFCGW